MTPRENLLRSMRRQGFEAVPVAPGAFCPSQAEAFQKRFGHGDIAGWFGSPVRDVWLPQEATYADGRALYRRERLPGDIWFDAWGVGHSRRPGCWHMTRMHHPLQGEDVTVDEIRRYPAPRNARERLDELATAVRGLAARGLASMGSMACTIWEGAW